MSKFKESYRIESNRLKNWNYSWKGLYFVTINTKFFQNDFGEIVDGEMKHSNLGNKVYEEWAKIPMIRPDMNIIIDEFTIMPNHFHGIIGIDRNKHNTFPLISNIDEILSEKGSLSPNLFGPQRKNLGAIIRGFKGAVKSFAKKNNILFDWHPRYYDKLIQDEIALDNIRKYIRNNVSNWENKSQ